MAQQNGENPLLRQRRGKPQASLIYTPAPENPPEGSELVTPGAFESKIEMGVGGGRRRGGCEIKEIG